MAKVGVSLHESKAPHHATSALSLPPIRLLLSMDYLRRWELLGECDYINTDLMDSVQADGVHWNIYQKISLRNRPTLPKDINQSTRADLLKGVSLTGTTTVTILYKQGRPSCSLPAELSHFRPNLLPSKHT